MGNVDHLYNASNSHDTAFISFANDETPRLGGRVADGLGMRRISVESLVKKPQTVNECRDSHIDIDGRNEVNVFGLNPASANWTHAV